MAASFAAIQPGRGDLAATLMALGRSCLQLLLSSTTTWVLGLPHALAVLHGKTRRGALVFDSADLNKDAHILPQAFLSAMRGDDEQEFRRQCIESLTRSEALDLMID